MPPLRVWPGLLPLARHYSSRKCNNIDVNVTTLGKDCCLIVDSFEKKLSGKKTRLGDKETGREGNGRQAHGDSFTV